MPKGSICGFLGRNGAGKTTTIKVLLGMARPTAGEARVFGLPASAEQASVEIRRRTGFVSDDKELYNYLTVREMVRFTAGFFPRWRKDLEDRYLRAFELPPDRKVKALSRGMRTKLALLLALCRGAELLILDEPTSGLDPAMTEEVLQALVTHVGREEMTVFFSSHQIAEVDQIADRVAIIDHGRIVVSGAARRPAGALLPDSARVRGRRAGRGVPRAGGGARTAAKGACSRCFERRLRRHRRGGARAGAGVGGRDARHAQRRSSSRPSSRRRTEAAWYKSWLETLSRFLIGLALLICSVAASVLTYPTVEKLLTTDADGRSGRGDRKEVLEAVILAGSFRGTLVALFGQNLVQFWTIFAVILGTGGLLSQVSGGGGAVHAVAAGVAPRAARGAGRGRPGGAAILALVPRYHSAPVARDGAELQPRRRARARACLFGRCGVLQPLVPAVDGVQRRLASAAVRALRGGRCWRWPNSSWTGSRATA